MSYFEKIASEIRIRRGIFHFEGLLCIFAIVLSGIINVVQAFGPYKYSFDPVLVAIYIVHILNILMEMCINPGCVQIIKYGTGSNKKDDRGENKNNLGTNDESKDINTNILHSDNSDINSNILHSDNPCDKNRDNPQSVPGTGKSRDNVSHGGWCGLFNTPYAQFFATQLLIWVMLGILLFPIYYVAVTTNDILPHDDRNPWTSFLSIADYSLLSYASTICATYNVAIIRHVTEKLASHKNDNEIKNRIEFVQSMKKGCNIAFSLFFFVYTNWYSLRLDHGLCFVTIVTINSAVINVSSEFASRPYQQYKNISKDFGAKNYLVSILSLASVVAKLYFVRQERNEKQS